MIGKRFGRLTITSDAPHEKGHRSFICKCDCGRSKKVRFGHLKSGDTKSCGCLQKELMSKRTMTHGLSLKNGKETRLHRIWENMKARCLTETHQSYKNYGDRGIMVCDEWLDYKVFYDWAMSNGYKNNLTIDRVDNDGDYTPDNCKWVKKGHQGRNQRSTKLTIDDARDIRCLSSQGYSQQRIADIYGISKWHIQNIIKNRRWKENL